MKDFEENVVLATVDYDALETWEITEIWGLDKEQENILNAALQAGFDAENAIDNILNNNFTLLGEITSLYDAGYYFATEYYGVDFGGSEYVQDFFDFEGLAENTLRYSDDTWLTDNGLLIYTK